MALRSQNINLLEKKKKEFTAIHIVYEPIFDEKVPLPCFFTDQIHLTYRSS